VTEELSDLIDDPKKAEKLEKLIEKKVEKSVIEEKTQKTNDSTRDLSRRSFLKKLGAGAIGLGALGVSPSAAGFSRVLSTSEEGSGGGLDADTVDGKDASEIGGVPSGVILMWSGSISNIPSGWVLCDGNNGTPNLQDRFVVGAGANYTVDSTGGSANVTLTESEMPSHNHSGSTTTDGSHSHTYYTGRDNGGTPGSSGSADSVDTASTASAGDHNHSLSINSSGGDSAHENRPPYYALAYIMKT